MKHFPFHRAPRTAHSPRRHALSLLELVAVLVILGVLISVGVSVRPQTLNITGAQTDARRLALDLMQARRRAIFTGDNHLLLMQTSGGSITGYTLHRRTGGSTTAVDSYHAFPAGVVVTCVPTNPEFTFEGGAVAGNVLTLTAGTHSWTVTVTQLTGTVSVTGS